MHDLQGLLDAGDKVDETDAEYQSVVARMKAEVTKDDTSSRVVDVRIEQTSTCSFLLLHLSYLLTYFLVVQTESSTTKSMKNTPTWVENVFSLSVKHSRNGEASTLLQPKPSQVPSQNTKSKINTLQLPILL